MLQTAYHVGSRWHSLADRVLAGEVPTFEEGLEILASPDAHLLDLLSAAYRVRSHYFGTTVKLNYLVNAKSGICPEDCGYCSQSRVSHAEIERYQMLSVEEIIARADRAVELKASTCCIVTSGKHPTEREMSIITAAIKIIKTRHPGLKLCASLGTLTTDEARTLGAAGADRYNHNYNTSADHYEKICSTHTHEDRVNTVQTAADAGISPCSGIIMGMGETPEDLVAVSFQLRESQAASIPINSLIPIPGTPLYGNTPPLDPRFCLKVLCLFRFVCADREIRVSAGREQHFRSLQPLSLYAANSIFVGDYLTTEGQAASMDWQMIEDLGFTVETINT